MVGGAPGERREVALDPRRCSRQAENAQCGPEREHRQAGSERSAAPAAARRDGAARQARLRGHHSLKSPINTVGWRVARHQLVEQRLELAAPVPRAQVEVGRHHAPAVPSSARRSHTMAPRASPPWLSNTTRRTASPRAGSAGRCRTSRARRDAAADPRCTSCRAPRRAPRPDRCRCGRGAIRPPAARSRRRRSRAGPRTFRATSLPAVPAPTAMHVVAGDAQVGSRRAPRLDQRRSAQVSSERRSRDPDHDHAGWRISGRRSQAPSRSPNKVIRTIPAPCRTGCRADSRGPDLRGAGHQVDHGERRDRQQPQHRHGPAARAARGAC